MVSSILNFKKELERRGHGVYIFASRNIRLRESHHARDVFLYSGIEFKPYPQYSVALFPYNSITKLKSLDIDLIHAQTPFFMGFAGLINAKIARYPIVGSFHTLVNNRAVVNYYYPKNGQLKRLTTKYLWKYVVFFYKKCNLTIVPSEIIGNSLRRYDVDNIRVVPNSVDTKVFNPKVNGENMRSALGIKRDEKMVLYVGRLSREKKIEVLLQAAKVISRKNEKVKFVVAGSGPAESHYRNMARRLGLKNVNFLGSVDRKALPKVYAASDVFCLPSTFETQGIVSLEAMASGKPVVCADYLALKELVANGRNGEKFRPGDYIMCSRKIEKVLNSPEAYVNSALEKAREFSTEKATDRLLNVYEELVLAA